MYLPCRRIQTFTAECSTAWATSCSTGDRVRFFLWNLITGGGGHTCALLHTCVWVWVCERAQHGDHSEQAATRIQTANHLFIVILHPSNNYGHSYCWDGWTGISGHTHGLTWETRPLALWPNIPISHIILIMNKSFILMPSARLD